ncbi:MAG: cobalamin-dependent protein [Oscillospiraceae bacterium]
MFVTNVYDEGGHLMTGADPAAMVALLEGLGVDALGVNCSLGPDKMLPVVEQLCKYSSVPVIVNPNAGLPSTKNGKTEFNINAEAFSDCMRKIAVSGAAVLGGCCGTTPEFIKKTVEKTADIPLNITEKNYTLVSSYTHAHEVGGKKPTLIGERINPTGKPKFKEALRRNDIPYIVNEGLSQAEKGVHILDVNVGLPEIDEKEMMIRAVLQLQAVCELPLQIDSTDPAVLEGAMRIYNGKPLVNSVNGDEESMESVFPLVKKYGGTVIALTLDKDGIPETAAERFAIAEKIIARAAEYGIAKKDIVADPLALTVSSNQESANITLDTVKMLKNAGIRTSLGVSNISFGLPHRETVNSVFFTAALCAGLDCAIMNPFAEGMLNAYYAFNALTGRDAACAEYISYAAGITDTAVTAGEALGLKAAVTKGLREQAVKAAHELAENTPPLEIINNYIIPALDTVGNDFENKKAYLPQLLMSAEAASAAFEVIKEKLPPKSESSDRKVILATVKGDIHDIGKNIVKVMLESYGFTVCDLGRDVPPEAVVKAALEENCRLVGLSALMTTTVPSMEETIKQLKKADPKIKTIVGGAVLTQEYADMIGADYYGRDAMESVRCAEKFYSE